MTPITEGSDVRHGLAKLLRDQKDRTIDTGQEQIAARDFLCRRPFPHSAYPLEFFRRSIYNVTLQELQNPDNQEQKDEHHQVLRFRVAAVRSRHL